MRSSSGVARSLDEAEFAAFHAALAAEPPSASVAASRLTAEQLWWKARVVGRLVEQSRARERADRPAELGRWLGVGASAAGVLAFFTWLAQTSLPPGATSQLALLAAFLLLPAALLAAGVLWARS